MNQQQQFAAKQIIWAKVQPYPWWPGKIINHFKQNNRRVYKVSFFADPTYCFLHEHQLVHFMDFDHSLNDVFPIDFKLERAIQMANIAFELINAPAQSSERQVFSADHESSRQEVIDQTIEENSISNNDNVTSPLIIEEEPERFVDSEASQFFQSTITHENVIHLIEAHASTQNQESYCYSMRKEKVFFLNNLKKMLLSKYKLSSLSEKEQNLPSNRSFTLEFKRNVKSQNNGINQEQTIKTNFKRCKIIHRTKFQKKSHPHRQKKIDNLKISCMRKIFKLLRPSGEEKKQLKIKARQIINKISSISDNNLTKLQNLFILLTKSINKQSQSQNTFELLENYHQYLDKIETEKHLDDEGSKMTQISTPLN